MRNTRAAYAAISVLHRPVESAVESSDGWGSATVRISSALLTRGTHGGRRGSCGTDGRATAYPYGFVRLGGDRTLRDGFSGTAIDSSRPATPEIL